MTATGYCLALICIILASCYQPIGLSALVIWCLLFAVYPPTLLASVSLLRIYPVWQQPWQIEFTSNQRMLVEILNDGVSNDFFSILSCREMLSKRRYRVLIMRDCLEKSDYHQLQLLLNNNQPTGF